MAFRPGLCGFNTDLYLKASGAGLYATCVFGKIAVVDPVKDIEELI
jgi:hypothetical protein